MGLPHRRSGQQLDPALLDLAERRNAEREPGGAFGHRHRTPRRAGGAYTLGECVGEGLYRVHLARIGYSTGSSGPNGTLIGPSSAPPTWEQYSAEAEAEYDIDAAHEAAPSGSSWNGSTADYTDPGRWTEHRSFAGQRPMATGEVEEQRGYGRLHGRPVLIQIVRWDPAA